MIGLIPNLNDFLVGIRLTNLLPIRLKKVGCDTFINELRYKIAYERQNNTILQNGTVHESCLESIYTQDLFGMGLFDV
jgi:hypothetical protein